MGINSLCLASFFLFFFFFLLTPYPKSGKMVTANSSLDLREKLSNSHGYRLRGEGEGSTSLL